MNNNKTQDAHATNWENASGKTGSLFNEIIRKKRVIDDRRMHETLGKSFLCFVASYDKNGKLLDRCYCESGNDRERKLFDDEIECFSESEASEETIKMVFDRKNSDMLVATTLYQHKVVERSDGEKTTSDFLEKIIIPVPETIRSNAALFVLYRVNGTFTEADHIGSVYVLTLFSLLESILHMRNENTLTNEFMDGVLNSMTHYEILTLKEILDAINGDEGIFVGTEIAKKLSCARSITVQTVKKMVVAGIFKSASLGMRGTYIKILKPAIRDHLKSMIQSATHH